MFIKSVLLSISLLTLVGCGNGNEEETVESTNDIEEQESDADTGASPEEEGNGEEDERAEIDYDIEYESVIAGTSSVAEFLSLFEIPLVGVSEQDNIPEFYVDVERVGAPRQLNMEVIVNLNPDLFIGDQSLADLSEEDMAAHDIPALYLDNSSYDEVFGSIEEIGEIFDREEEAQEIINELRQNEEEALQGAEELEGKKVVLLFGTGDGYMLTTQHAYLGSLLNRIGVDNLADSLADAPQPYVPFSLEAIVAEDPEVILALAHGNPEQARMAFEEELESELWQETTAVQEGSVYFLDDSTFPVTGNIRAVETLEQLKELLLEGSDE